MSILHTSEGGLENVPRRVQILADHMASKSVTEPVVQTRLRMRETIQLAPSQPTITVVSITAGTNMQGSSGRGLHEMETLHPQRRVEVVKDSPEVRKRLLAAYERELLNDNDLFRLICENRGRHPEAIEGVTEPLTEEDLDRYLTAPNMTVLECADPNDPSAPSQGFMIFQHPGNSETDHEAMVRTVYKTQLPLAQHRFRLGHGVEQLAVEQGLSEGNLWCIYELISKQNKFVTAALFREFFKRIHALEVQRGRPIAGGLGRCLDKAHIGSHVNYKGNQPIKTMIANNFGMHLVADVPTDARRTVRVSKQRAQSALGTELQSLAHTEDGSDVILPVNLGFGLYYGKNRDIENAVGTMDVIK